MKNRIQTYIELLFFMKITISKSLRVKMKRFRKKRYRTKKKRRNSDIHLKFVYVISIIRKLIDLALRIIHDVQSCTAVSQIVIFLLPVKI